MIKLYINDIWKDYEPSNTIFIISPGAGTFKNKKAYEILEKNYKVLYFGKTGGIYDKYPHNSLSLAYFHETNKKRNKPASPLRSKNA